MDRLLVLRLRNHGCAAEVRINDITVLRAPACGAMRSLAVNEFLFEGQNHLSLEIDPAPSALDGDMPPRVALGPTDASVRLLLPRIGRPGNESQARALAELDWAAAEGDVVAPPIHVRRTIDLPVKFPRWRWLDMPVVDDPASAQPVVARFIQTLALALAKGEADAMVQAARLRFEELAMAYQQPVAELVARWRARIQLLQASKALQVMVPTLADVTLRPCAGGRLLECVAPDGQPILRTEAADDGSRHAWPVRVAVIDGQCHILR